MTTPTDVETPAKEMIAHKVQRGVLSNGGPVTGEKVVQPTEVQPKKVTINLVSGLYYSNVQQLKKS